MPVFKGVLTMSAKTIPCPMCGAPDGTVDSGGVTPNGQPISVSCGCRDFTKHLLNAVDHPADWDVPGLLRDAANAIESLEGLCERQRLDLDRQCLQVQRLEAKLHRIQAEVADATEH